MGRNPWGKKKKSEIGGRADGQGCVQPYLCRAGSLGVPTTISLLLRTPSEPCNQTQVSITTCSTQRQTRARTDQEQVPKCCVCALMEHLGKRRLGGGVVVCRALSLRNHASLLLGVLFGHIHTCCTAPTVSWVATASLHSDDLEYLFQDCSREGLGPAREEGICQKAHTPTEFSLQINWFSEKGAEHLAERALSSPGRVDAGSWSPATTCPTFWPANVVTASGTREQLCSSHLQCVTGRNPVISAANRKV